MALPDTLLLRLIEAVRRHDLGGSFVMLGRQRWIGARRGQSGRLLRFTIEKHLPGLTEDDLKNPDDIYSERFFERLGFDSVDSLDFSDHEGASIVQDLSGDLSDDLLGRFDVVYDGGTCEHIFDLPRAFRNIDAMLKPGGVLIGHSPCNNWLNHSFYQLSPEIVFGFWERAMGYEVLELTLQPMLPNFVTQTARTTNPNKTGNRPRLGRPLPDKAPIVLNYLVRKPRAEVVADAGVYQTDYVRKWAS